MDCIHANASLDNSLIVTGANINVNQGTIDYTRYIGLLHRIMWVEAAVPIAGIGGAIRGTNIHGSSTGAGDSSYGVAMLLKADSALSVAYSKITNRLTALEISLTITRPTGSYHPNNVLNLGSNRWSFKPEIALSHPFGTEEKWEIDAYGNAYFYTDNTSYHGRGILRQQPLPGLKGHISYSFTDNLWASLDTRYSFRGSTSVNGASQNNPQRNFLLGSEVNVSLNPKNSLVFEFTKALVHVNGAAVVGFSVKYDYTWGISHK